MHNIEYYEYSFSKSKKDIEKELDAYISEATRFESGNGLYTPIRWQDNNVYDNYEDAQRAIEKLDNHWYDQIAVKFYEPIGPVFSKKLSELKERETKARRTYCSLNNKVHYVGVKSAFISCKNCGSKFASQYFGKSISNVCLLCEKDLRPQTVLDKIEAAKNKWLKLEKERAAEEKKLEKKAEREVFWLVKIEYHT